MTDADKIIDVLNGLLEAEQRSIALRLGESTLFVSWGRAKEQVLIQQIARRHQTNAEWIANALISLGGAPGLRVGDVNTGDLHFCDLGSTIERLCDDVAGFIRLYEHAGSLVGSCPAAAEVVNRILANHQQSAMELTEIGQPTP